MLCCRVRAMQRLFQRHGQLKSWPIEACLKQDGVHTCRRGVESVRCDYNVQYRAVGWVGGHQQQREFDKKSLRRQQRKRISRFRRHGEDPASRSAPGRLRRGVRACSSDLLPRSATRREKPFNQKLFGAARGGFRASLLRSARSHGVATIQCSISRSRQTCCRRRRKLRRRTPSPVTLTSNCSNSAGARPWNAGITPSAHPRPLPPRAALACDLLRLAHP